MLYGTVAFTLKDGRKADVSSVFVSGDHAGERVGIEADIGIGRMGREG